MKKRLLPLLCAVSLAFSLVLPVSAAGKQFSDVKPGAWYHDTVIRMADEGIIGGYPDGTFQPQKPISNMELLTLIMKILPADENVRKPDPSWLEEMETILMPGYWGNASICSAVARGIIYRIELTKEFWNSPADREQMAYFIAMLYSTSVGQPELNAQTAAAYLIGDYDVVENCEAHDAILWLYSMGIVTGDEYGRFNPYSTATRAEAASILNKLAHPETRTRYDWDEIKANQGLPKPEGPEVPQQTDGKDFTGMTRTRYEFDVAYDFCRQLENQIGIQIFYLPEWTEKEAGLISHHDIDYEEDAVYLHPDYFVDVLAELQKMKAAYDLYPDGFLKEVVQKKGSRKVEIILCPAHYQGTDCFGLHIYDFSNDAQKVDQIYYTGQGDSQYYSHEMGHMVMSSAGALAGWNKTVDRWEDMLRRSGRNDCVSSYARTNRPEDWAETWAYLWHQPDHVRQLIANGGSVLQEKVQFMSQLLDSGYSTINSSALPWSDLL